MLSPEQLIVIGLVGSVATQALRLLAEHFGFVPNKVIINVVLLVISAGLAVAFFGIPAAGADPVEGYVNAAVGIAGSALLIYNIVLDKVLATPPSKVE